MHELPSFSCVDRFGSRKKDAFKTVSAKQHKRAGSLRSSGAFTEVGSRQGGAELEKIGDGFGCLCFVQANRLIAALLNAPAKQHAL